MTNHKDKSWLERMGCRISAVASDISAHPFAQIGVILFCALWWIVGLPTDILTAALSILAITLTQMVLNRQNERELDAHRRDVAMHAKLDELVLTSRRARNEFAGIEDQLEEEEIVELKQEALAAVENGGGTLSEAEREQVAERAVEVATEEAAGRRKAGRAPRRQGPTAG